MINASLFFFFFLQLENYQILGHTLILLNPIVGPTNGLLGLITLYHDI